MKNARVAIAAAALLFPPFVSAIAQAPNPPPNSAPPPSAEAKISGVSKYRSWGAVNPEPYQVTPAVAALCAAATPIRTAEMIREERKRNPHADYHVRVYVTPSAKEAFERRRADLPAGTVVVKEKLPSAAATTPELLTVMVKRAKGYDAKGGDWQYYVLDGTGTKILADSRLKNCRDCHESRKTQGYLFRDYLPEPELLPTKGPGR